LILCLLTTSARAQDWPKPAEAGNKALDALVARCVEAGALTRTRDEKAGRDVLNFADPAKLARALADPPIGEVAPVRDALVARTSATPQPEQPAWIALLRGLGQATGDNKARAFASYFEGTNLSHTDANAAIDRFRQAAELFEKEGERAWQANCLHQIGLICYTRSGIQDALDCFKKTLVIRLEALDPRHLDVAASYNNIAGCYRRLGDPAKALETHQRALTIRLEALGPRHPDVADSHYNIAGCQRELGDPAKALETHQRALAIRLEALRPEAPRRRRQLRQHRRLPDRPAGFKRGHRKSRPRLAGAQAVRVIAPH
jgi:tetratricopeptide (TPR) repeat protein